MKAGAALFLLFLTGPALAQQEAVIDPTKNVLDTVFAQEKFQNLAREYEAKLRDAEMRRIKELAEQKDKYDFNLATILRSNSDSANVLLATQLKEMKNDFNERMTKQEQFRFESTGKSSGASDLWGLILGALGLMGLASGVGIAFVGMRRRAV